MFSKIHLVSSLITSSGSIDPKIQTMPVVALVLEDLNESRNNLRAFPLNAKVSIGREQTCDIVIVTDVVSKVHCEFKTNEQDGCVRCLLTDLSFNGTYVNGIKVGRNLEVEVDSGDIIVLGRPSKSDGVCSYAGRFRLHLGKDSKLLSRSHVSEGGGFALGISQDQKVSAVMASVETKDVKRLKLQESEAIQTSPDISRDELSLLISEVRAVREEVQAAVARIDELAEKFRVPEQRTLGDGSKKFLLRNLRKPSVGLLQSQKLQIPIECPKQCLKQASQQSCGSTPTQPNQIEPLDVKVWMGVGSGLISPTPNENDMRVLNQRGTL